ncbi:acetyl-CoA/propionyl-CoA carboxylase biotin carboxyl carrier protein [Catenulispora sp. GAS73]|uniref:acetyl/propionyl/methylcrotonyl-CoA carboxylase subunit alpha n=1 Tax=Catenulispora sp. GAS73 TaxID=3156269 RepID=UPI003515D1B4
MRRVLISNRGEIAVRVIRACRDAGLTSIAVYAEPDLDALHVRLADEAHALGGRGPGESYLDIGKILAVAKAAGADAVHPGYGFLAENHEFACATIDAGLTWIGPPPRAIVRLGDKVAARRIAQEVGAPMLAGTSEPVADAAEVVAFAREHGLPIVIKAAHGGGGRGMRVVRELADVEEAYGAAVREAVASFGRGECFVERYLDRARHVETQCLADVQGNVVVVSTRDCSLQRRHQKLVEEAPAPFLSPDQRDSLYEASKKILRHAGYVGAGTCEFLVGQAGEISFLEVNTRLQVEHPVSEEVTGLDLVLEQFRIADGEELGYDDPPAAGHSLEFRINAEDPGRGFLPTPGTVTAWRTPSGPGVRLDAGYTQGMTVPPVFDSLLAKLIVTGRTRAEALRRARRALAEFDVGGMPTVLPFHRAVVEDPAFAPRDPDEPFTVHTRWIENEFSGVPPAPQPASSPEPEPAEGREPLTVEVSGRRIEVVVPASLLAPVGVGAGVGVNGNAARRRGTPASRHRGGAVVGPAGDALVSQMAGTVVKVCVADGEQVSAGQTVVVLEAMKMEQPLDAHQDGVISGLSLKVGDAISSGASVCEIKAR